MKTPSALLLAICLPSVAPSAPAQGSGDYAHRAAANLAQTLAADSRLPDSLRHLSATALVALPDSGYVRILSDLEAGAFMRVLARTLHQLPDSLCGRYLQVGSGSPPDLWNMLPLLDSVEVNSWLGVLDRMARARATSQPPGRAASPEEVRAAYLAILNGLDADRRQRLAWIAQHPPPTANDACWSMRVIMDGMTQLPDSQLAPVVRTNFAPSRSANR